MATQSKNQAQNYKEFSEHNLFALTHKLDRQMSNHINRLLRARGYETISTRHLAMFDNIDTEGINIKLLAERIRISKQAISHLVKDAVQTGLVSVKTGKTDARQVIAKLTDKGIEFVGSLQPIIMEAQANILRESNISAEDLAITSQVLAAASAYLGKVEH